MRTVDEALTQLDIVSVEMSAGVGLLNALNAEPPGRCRELSLAITSLETGLLWLREATEILTETRTGPSEASAVASRDS